MHLLRGINHWSNLRRGIFGIALHKRVRAFCEFCFKRIRNFVVHKNSLGANAYLASISKTIQCRIFHSRINVGVLQHKQRIFTAKFKHKAL